MPRHRHGVRQSSVFGFSCPSGGTWYACELGTKFVGCCNNEPCSLGCEAGNLGPASFYQSQYGKFPDPICDRGSYPYTCAYSSPPFLDCCKSNPCNGGCLDGDLTSMYLSDEPTQACKFYSEGCGSTSSSSSSEAAFITSSTSTTAWL